MPAETSNAPKRLWGQLAPDVMPDGWEPEEDDPAWGFVSKDHPGAVAVWILVLPGQSAPPRAPRAASGGESA